MNDSNRTAQAPSGFVTPVTKWGNVAFVSGQLPRIDGELRFRGRVGEAVSLDDAQAAAALCAKACLAALDKALGGLEGVAQVLKLTGFVASAADFRAQGQVIDAASQALIEALGERGQHARSAVGVQQLPHGAPVEVELIVGLR